MTGKRAILVGEPMGLFIAQSEGLLDEVSGYTMAVAGAEFNVAVGLARLEHQTAYLTRLGSDPFGKRIERVLEDNHIGSQLVRYDPSRSTGFMLKGKVSQGDPPIFYFRKNSAASSLSREDVDSVDFSRYGYLHLTGILPALSPSALDASFYLMEKARFHGLTISFDPNLRPQLWPNQETMVDTINRLAALADYVLPGQAEGAVLCGTEDPVKIGSFYQSLGVRATVVKAGASGAYLSTSVTGEQIPGFRVERVVDTVGAGDGFAAGFLSGLMEGCSLRDSVRRGCAVGAIQVTCVGDNDGLPNRSELARFMGLEVLSNTPLTW